MCIRSLYFVFDGDLYIPRQQSLIDSDLLRARESRDVVVYSWVIDCVVVS